jgi:hypothetical protein
MLFKSRNKVKLVIVAITVIAFALSINFATWAQDKANTEPAKATMSQSAGQPAGMTASLIDAEKNAKDKTATVEVKVTGVKLIDPALTNKKPTTGEGHLHYQVDDGPVIATTAPKLSFHQLTPGKHRIVVMLANNDHTPAGPQQTIELTIP